MADLQEFQRKARPEVAELPAPVALMILCAASQYDRSFPVKDIGGEIVRSGYTIDGVKYKIGREHVLVDGVRQLAVVLQASPGYHERQGGGSNPDMRRYYFLSEDLKTVQMVLNLVQPASVAPMATGIIEAPMEGQLSGGDYKELVNQDWTSLAAEASEGTDEPNGPPEPLEGALEPLEGALEPLEGAPDPTEPAL